MKDVLTLAKKELKAIFSSKTHVFQIVLLPFLMIFGFMLMSTATMEAMPQNDEQFKATGYFINTPEYFKGPLQEIGLKEIEENAIEDIKNDIAEGDCDILILFPDDFELSDSMETMHNIEMWYNASDIESSYAQSLVIGILDSSRPVLFTVNANNPDSYNLGREVNMVKEMLMLSFPIYSIMAIFMSAQAIAAESIVGEKERGFMNMLLITPIKRKHIALGKAASIFCINILGGISSVVGLLTSVLVANNLPNVTPLAYTLSDYTMIFTSAMTGAFALTGLVLIISTLSSTIKQANALSGFAMTVLMLGGILSNMDSIKEVVANIGFLNYCIPMWNSIISMQNIIDASVSVFNICVTSSVNILFTIIIASLTARLFENEKIMQSR